MVASNRSSAIDILTQISAICTKGFPQLTAVRTPRGPILEHIPTLSVVDSYPLGSKYRYIHDRWLIQMDALILR